MQMILSRVVTFLAMACIASNTFEQAPRRFGDVEKIGNRMILENDSRLISVDRELTIGDTFAAEFDKSARLVSDPSVVDLISRIGQNLAAHSDLSMRCHFRILDIDGMDVLAFLGGRIYVNKGIIMTAGNEAELAGAMAHGMAHIAARHTARLIDREVALHVQVIRGLHDWHWSSLTPFRMLPSLADLEGVAETEREFEGEADQLAVQYLWNTGYDPNAYITLLRKLMQREKGLPGTRPQPFSFMPDTKDRIAASEQERSQLPQKEHYILNTPEFDSVKARLQAIDNAEKSEELPTGEEQKRPILKRRATEGGERETR
jgi:predicted Zn-dependent protease